MGLRAEPPAEEAVGEVGGEVSGEVGGEAPGRGGAPEGSAAVCGLKEFEFEAFTSPAAFTFPSPIGVRGLLPEGSFLIGLVTCNI